MILSSTLRTGFQKKQGDFLTYTRETTYWQKMEFIDYMSSFLITAFAIFLYVFIDESSAHMVLEETLQVYRTDAAALP